MDQTGPFEVAKITFDWLSWILDNGVHYTFEPTPFHAFILSKPGGMVVKPFPFSHSEMFALLSVLGYR